MSMPKGFEVAGRESGRNRLVMALGGKIKRGKTHCALTAPGPIAIFNTDMGLRGVGEKFEDKIIYKMDVDLPSIQDVADKEFERVHEAWMDLLSSTSVRSIVADTGTDLWELARLADFGRLEGVKSRYYGPLNAKFRRLLRASLKSDKNIISIHKLKHVYINDIRQKTMEMAGFPETGSWMEVVATMERPGDNEEYEEDFVLTIDDNRFNPALNGQVLVGDAATFPFLASIVTGTSPIDWM